MNEDLNKKLLKPPFKIELETQKSILNDFQATKIIQKNFIYYNQIVLIGLH